MIRERRAVSPVIGVVLMVAIVVVLAGVFGGLLLGFESELPTVTEPSTYEMDYDRDGSGNGGVAFVNVTITGGASYDGSKVFVVDSDGNDVAWEHIWMGDPDMTTPDYVHVDGQGSDDALNCITEGEVYRVVHRGEETSTVLATYEVTRAPPPSSVTTCQS